MSVDAPTKQSLRIATYYAFFSAAWILFSDRAITWFIRDPETLIVAASIKGCFFVLVTATTLFFLVRQQLRRVGEKALEQQRATEARKVSEERFRALAALSPDIISIFDLEGRMVFNSAAAARIHGYREEDLLGKPTFDLVHPDDRAAVQSAFAKALDPGEGHIVVRYRYRNADGSYKWMEAAGKNELKNPHIQGIIAISRDISEQITQEQVLRESEGRLRRAERIAGLGNWALYPDSGEIVGSEGARRICGVPSIYVTYEKIRSLMFPEYQKQLDESVSRLVREGVSFEAEYRLTRDDDKKVVDIHVLAELDADRKIVFGTIQDVTERKDAEAVMRLESAALAAAANAIAITDRDGKLVWFNPAFTKLTGYVAEEAYGRKIGELLTSGKHDPKFFREMWETILSDKPWHGELTNRRKDGTYYREEQTITPVHDDAKRITHFVAIKQDVTVRKALEAQVYRSQRLDSIGCLAGGIAHDLNNILSPILLAPAVLRDSITDPKALATLDAVETSAKRGASVIRQLLTFSRGGDAAGDHVLVQWRHIVREMMNIMRETFPKNITVVPRFIGDIWLIPADATQLHQVLMNLCVNARDAMPEGGTIAIGLENVELSEAATMASPKASPGPHVLLSVTDTGTGIAPEHLDKVFDPFFTTKEVGKGTGLGLSSVLGIVRAHKGVIQVSSKLGEGTQFRVYLPAARDEAEMVVSKAATLGLDGAESILLVDDEDSVRTVTARILEGRGYRVITARHGAHALELYRARGAEISAVVTDLMMPVMDGQTMIGELRALAPTLPIVAISGYSGPQTVSDERMQPPVPVLMKPFEMEDLLVMLKEVLKAHR